jgi:LysW-gamma-L-lysine carboxypeptidase
MTAVKLLRKMVEIYSPSGQERELAMFLKDEMGSLGFNVHIDEVGNIVGKVGRGEHEVLLVGHLDTVAGEIAVGVKEGKLYGRGSVDAKGSLAAFIEAAAEFRSSLALRIYVIGVVEEETTSKGAKYLLDKFKPNYVIVGEPSGWDAITIGYKGSIHIAYSLRKPLRHRAHQEGTTAEEAVKFYNALEDEYDTGKGFESVAVNLLSINTANDGLRESAEMELELRTPPGFDFVGFKQSILKLKGSAEVELYEEAKAIKVGKRNELVRGFLRAIRALGGEPTFKVKTGSSDMNILGRGWDVPIVAYGPGDSSLDHTPDEHIEIEEYKKAIKVLSCLLKDLSRKSGKQAS